MQTHFIWTQIAVLVDVQHGHALIDNALPAGDSFSPNLHLAFSRAVTESLAIADTASWVDVQQTLLTGDGRFPDTVNVAVSVNFMTILHRGSV